MAEDREKPRTRIRIDVSDLVLEIISIVIAILLAFAVQQWRQHVSDQQKVAASLHNIRQEILTNVSGVAEEQAHHRRVTEAFGALLKATENSQQLSFRQYVGVFSRSSPTGFHGVPDESVAWKIAQSDGSATLMDYPTRVAITRAYLAQGDTASTSIQFVRSFESAQPAGADNFYFAADSELGELGDVVASEARAIFEGCHALAAIDRALGERRAPPVAPCR